MRLSLLFIFLSIFGFSQTETHQFPKIPSSISVPISLPISEIQRLTNQSITGTLYEDQSYENNDNDQLKTKVEKDGEITMKALTNNRLLFSVPLKIWAEKGIGTLGLYSYQETQFRVVMNFISSVEFLQNWQVKTTTSTAGFVWKEKPVLDFGKIKFPLASVIEKILVKQQKDFTTVIDAQIQQKMNLQPYILKVWNNFSEPMKISDEYNTWLKITPQTVKMSPLEIYLDKMKTTVSIDLFSETFVGTKPSKNPLVNAVPYFTPAQNLGKEFLLKTTTNIPFSEATAIAQKQFQGKEFSFNEGKSKIKVEDIKVYAENENVVIEIQENSNLIAQLDCAVSLSELAISENYTKPVLNETFAIDIKEGRHPIIEKSLPLGEKYIPNDVFLDKDAQQIIMVTGPNMAGKSAILRQTAIICLLAQIGSFVPAKHAEIGILDKIFTRVGATDNISAGESTFMVEMNEAANILNNISERSLILLDEIGRGTSTYDGVSIAWAIAEYLHQHSTQPKTLFATHYHELNEMSVNFERIKNFHVTIQENKGNIIFLRKLVSGGSEHSFGIHVAKLAGMPSKVVNRASEILKTLEDSRSNSVSTEKIKRVTEENLQLSFFQLDDPVLENIREELTKIDINTLTPIEALMKLNAIKKMIGK